MREEAINKKSGNHTLMLEFCKKYFPMKMDITKEIAGELGITLIENQSTWNRELLAGKINELLTTDFQKLISILYRVDVSEDKLKKLLQENPTADAGLIIADLMIERQLQKSKSKKETKINNDIPDDESW